MMIAELDEVSYDLEVDGELVRRTLHRRVWERGGWATVAIAFQERRPDGSWKPAKLVMIRLSRVRDAWKKHASITLHGGEALQLAEALEGWREALAGGSADSPDE